MDTSGIREDLFNQLESNLASKLRDEFLEKFRTAFDPTPHFRKVMLQFFLKFMTEVSSIDYNGKNLRP